ncbi:MAG TPA: hypothetical protein VNR17_04030 [Luteimicrobium sp.]|nr:hypothetical protein [Luteimicrobium sp.]
MQLLAPGVRWPLPPLLDDEAVVRQARATWSRRGIGRGGTLVLTPARVVFEPNTFEADIGLRRRVWLLTEVRRAGLASRRPTLFDGGLRRRLALLTADGRTERFVVAEPAAFAAEIDRAAAAARRR